MSAVDIRHTAEWPRIRLQVLDRDGWRCRDCGKAGRLEVHHVNRVADGGTNALANLRTLCIGCHQKAHATPKSAERRRWVSWAKELL